MQRHRNSASNFCSCCTLPPIMQYNPLSWSPLTQKGQKKTPRLPVWGKVCVWLSGFACKIMLQGCLWLTCPMVAKRVYFWFGRRPLNCQLIMQRKYSQLVNFLWPWFQHRGKHLDLISQKLHSLNSDSASIFLWPYTYQEKWTNLYLRFDCRMMKRTQWTGDGQHIVLILVNKQFNSDRYRYVHGNKHM